MLDRARLANCDDEVALRKLAASCTMVGPLSYRLEREPDFFALTKLQGEDAETRVIDAGEPGTLAAMATSVVGRRRFGGTLRPMRYLADLKVHPGARGKGYAGALMQVAVERMRRDRIPAFGVVLAGNRAMASVVAARGGQRSALRFRPIARLENYNVLPLCIPRAPDGVTVRPAERCDVSELVALWNRLQRARELSPVWRESSWLAQVEATPGLGIERFWVARRRGRVVAFAGVWDAASIKQVRLLALSPALRLLRPIYDAPARLLGRPPMPRDGEVLPFVYVTHFCAETVGDLRALLVRIGEGLARSRHLYFDLALDARDPLAGALRGFVKTRLSFDLYSIEADDSGSAPPLGPAYFDMALV